MSSHEFAQMFIDTIHSVEQRCMAADGPVTPTCKEITDDELRKLYAAAQQVTRASLAPAPQVVAEVVTIDVPGHRRARVIRALDLEWIVKVPDGAKLAVIADEPGRPCTVCAKPRAEHGTYPTCASHPYTADGTCQFVMGAACVGAECVQGCVRGRALA
jgi:hypothetical protein